MIVVDEIYMNNDDASSNTLVGCEEKHNQLVSVSSWMSLLFGWLQDPFVRCR
jgi:hypothetical protein